MVSVYEYKPSVPVAIIGTGVFGIAALYHIFLFVKLKTWCFWMMVLASLMETSAFTTRLHSALYPAETKQFLVSYLLFILSPFIMTAALFTTFSRLTWYTTPPFQHKFTTTWIPSSIFSKVFKLAFLASFVTAFAGAGGLVGSSTTANPKTFTSSSHMIHASMIIQTAITGLFGIVTIHYTVVSRHWIPSTVLSTDTPRLPWHKLLWALNSAAFFLTLRNVYYVLQFSPNLPSVTAFIRTHESMFWVFDTVPVLTVINALSLAHPGHCLPRPYTRFWFRTGKIEKLEKKMLESQNWPSSDNEPAAIGNGHHQSTDQNGQRTWWLTAQGSDADVERQRQEHKSATASFVVEKSAPVSVNDPTSLSYKSPSWPLNVHLPNRN